MAAYQKSLPAGDSVPKGTRDYYANYVGKYVPGFAADYKRANQPAYTRVSKMTVVRESQHKAEWDELLSAASKYYRAYGTSKDYSSGAVQGTWKNYVQSSIQPWINQHPAFKAELNAYGPDFVNGLVAP